MIRLCAFDLDGTLVDSIADIAAGLNAALAELGYPTHTVEAVRGMVGNGAATLCQRALPEGEREQWQRLLPVYLRHYDAACCGETHAYDGVCDLLRQLRSSGVKTAVLSNKDHPQVVKVVDYALGKDCFDMIQGQTGDFPKKPAPQGLQRILEQLGVTPAETVYVGDSDVDILLGKAVGAVTVGTPWGMRSRQELEQAGADYIVENPAQIAEIIASLQK